MQETQDTRIQSLRQEDPLEQEMATHPSTLDWEISWAEEPGGLHEVAESDRTEDTYKNLYHHHFGSKLKL